MKTMKSSTWIKRLRELNSIPISFFSDYDKLSEEEKLHLGFISANIDNDLGEWADIQEELEKKQCIFN